MLSERLQTNPRAAELSAFPAQATTSELVWRRFVGSLDLLELSARSVAVVAPHPDDETLACGGLQAGLAALGAVVKVVAVTDGEGSHPTVRSLAAVRRGEQQRALTTLGVTAAPRRIGLPDGHVADHEARLVEVLEEHCGDADVLIAPWNSDGHTDHDACGRAAQVAGGRSGQRVLAYPVWAWQWANPADLWVLPWRRWNLDAGTRAKKAAALAHFSSQITDRLGPPVVDALALARFQRPWEVFADVG